jgi:hypothetical protein
MIFVLKICSCLNGKVINNLGLKGLTVSMQVTLIKIRSQINLSHLVINHGVKTHNPEFIGAEEVDYS